MKILLINFDNVDETEKPLKHKLQSSGKEADPVPMPRSTVRPQSSAGVCGTPWLAAAPQDQPGRPSSSRELAGHPDSAPGAGHGIGARGGLGSEWDKAAQKGAEAISGAMGMFLPLAVDMTLWEYTSKPSKLPFKHLIVSSM